MLSSVSVLTHLQRRIYLRHSRANFPSATPSTPPPRTSHRRLCCRFLLGLANEINPLRATVPMTGIGCSTCSSAQARACAYYLCLCSAHPLCRSSNPSRRSSEPKRKRCIAKSRKTNNLYSWEGAQMFAVCKATPLLIKKYQPRLWLTTAMACHMYVKGFPCTRCELCERVKHDAEGFRKQMIILIS